MSCVDRFGESVDAVVVVISPNPSLVAETGLSKALEMAVSRRVYVDRLPQGRVLIALEYSTIKEIVKMVMRPRLPEVRHPMSTQADASNTTIHPQLSRGQGRTSSSHGEVLDCEAVCPPRPLHASPDDQTTCNVHLQQPMTIPGLYRESRFSDVTAQRISHSVSTERYGSSLARAMAYAGGVYCTSRHMRGREYEALLGLCLSVLTGLRLCPLLRERGMDGISGVCLPCLPCLTSTGILYQKMPLCVRLARQTNIYLPCSSSILCPSLFATILPSFSSYHGCRANA
jgi:hypothetical protein